VSTAKCKRGCHPEHGHCHNPGECKCQYGWQGERCDECTPYPGCLHGTCGNKPWKCFCKINWGGLLCNMGTKPHTLRHSVHEMASKQVVDKELKKKHKQIRKNLNYCGTHSPCLNGATCINVEPNKYRCQCLPGFEGENCHIGSLHMTFLFSSSNSQCICPLGFRGFLCELQEHSCVTTLCQNGGRCLDTAAGQVCHCLPGFQGIFCEVIIPRQYLFILFLMGCAWVREGMGESGEIGSLHSNKSDLSIQAAADKPAIICLTQSALPRTSLAPLCVFLVIVFSDLIGLNPTPAGELHFHQ
uniref:EGF-like domain-containing protein n=1 Tax=Eptatretus burgeri TaxID=7764 RepID=A0A8C4R715_EPTBU